MSVERVRIISEQSAGPVPCPASTLPLLVDMDGFLVRADLESEALIANLERNIVAFSRAIRGERDEDASPIDAASVAEFARRGVDVASLPLEAELVDYITACIETGREVHLLTSASQEIADAVASRIGGLAGAIGSQPGRPFGASDKLAFAEAQHPDGFAYAGRTPALLARARAVVINRNSTGSTVGVGGPAPLVETEIGTPPRTTGAGLRLWIKALRCHQWSKNALVFVPLILGHAYLDAAAIATCLIGFLLMSLLASGTYIVNDLMDLDADRKHATKRNRPLARGDIPAGTAIVVASILISGSLAAAYTISLAFFATLSAYLVTTLAYSFYLKRKLLVDVFVLSVLFTLRIAMGIALAGVVASPWLLTFTMFFFLSLSLAKRHVEVVNAVQAGQATIPGRDYRATDLPLTISLGMASNAVAMLVIFLYLAFDAMPHGFYRQPYWLWGAAFVVFFWSLRIWGLSHRGQLDADPVAFAIRDRTSIVLGLVVAAVFALAL